MLPEVLSQSSQTNGGEEVDGEPGVSGIVSWHQTFPGLGHGGIPGPVTQLGHAQELGQLLEQDLDEDPGAGGCVVFIEFDDLEHLPADGVGVQEMREELGHVSELPSLQPVDSVVGVNEDLHEGLLVGLVDLTEPLTHQTKELLVCPLLGAAVNDHVTQLRLLAGLDVQLVQLVDCLLKVKSGLDCQIDGSSQRNQICLSSINNGLLLGFLFIRIIIRGAAGPGALAPATSSYNQNIFISTN